MSVFLSLLSLTASALASSQIPFSSPPPSAATPLTLPTTCYGLTAVSRSIDLGGSLTRTTTTYSLEQNRRCSTWLVGVQGQEGFVEAWESNEGQPKAELELVRVGRTAANTTYYTLTPSSSSPTIALSSVLSHQSTALPATLPQTAEAVSLLWSDDLLSPIAFLSDDERTKITEYKVRIKTPSPRILSVKGPEGFETVHSKGQAGATFLAKASVVGLGPQVASVHYVQPEAIASFRSLHRLLEVSHWGSNLAVMDSIDLFNAGPLLSGHFARIDHQKLAMQRRTNALAISSLSFVLPPRASSPYFYDIVGNVSTSNFRPSSSGSTGFELPSAKKGKKANNKNAATSLLEIKPRYPLMGGWNYTFTMGYDVPLQDFLKTRKEDGAYVLAVPFLTPVKDIAVDDVVVEIRLPEAARNIKVHLPFSVDSLSYPTSAPAYWGTTEGYTKTYLDSTGRPTITLARKDCGDRHGGLVIIEYTASPLLDLFQKPVAIATFFSTLVLAIVGAKRIEWGIGK
ncbi:hypothetical protein RQP46_004731 [Phenoliferia psychrophenolica]